MTVLYLTSHVLEEDFSSRYGVVAHMPNPAGQNFHGKVLRALSLVEDVHACCLVPQALGRFERDDFEQDGIHYAYFYGPSNRYLRALTLPGTMAKHIASKHSKDKQPVILYDALSATLSLAARKLSQKLHAPRIPILTDEIANITGATESFVKRIHSLNAEADASIALTQGLVESYGLASKPHFIQPAFVEEEPVPPKQSDRPYLYYGGALFIKDGTKDLIEAYQELRPDYDLVISGHGNYEKETEEASRNIPGIHYLGQISKQKHFQYIAGSALCLNPRHYNPKLDACAVPSKVMEYLVYGDYIVSTLSTPLREEFGASINWIEGDFKTFLKAHLNQQGKLINLTKNDAKKSIVEQYGQQKSALNLQRFLKNLDAEGYRR